jgi:Bifunctional DNA primase/polymerase, N-terminal.
MTNNQMEAAAWLFERGYDVFQIASDAKIPHPKTAVNGCLTVAVFPEDVAQWWTEYPTANVGIRAGSKVVILDIDTKGGKNGVADLNAILASAGETIPRDTPCVITPTGGRHLYFKCPNGVKFKASTGLGKTGGIDIRAGNTYVLAPPSEVAGVPYRWHVPTVPVDELPPLPECMAAMISRRDERPTGVATLPVPATENDVMQRVYKWLDTAEHAISGQGGSRATFRALCGVYHGFALDETQLRDAFDYFNATKCNPPWESQREIDHKIDGVLASDLPTRGRGYLITEPMGGPVVRPVLTPEQDAAIGAMFAIAPEPEGDDPEDETDEPVAKKTPRRLPLASETPLPDNLLNVPGFVTTYVDFALRGARRPHRQASLVGALACLTHAICRRVRNRQTRPGAYYLCVAPSGAGKDFARKMTAHIMAQAGVMKEVVSSVSSGEALEDKLLLHGKTLLLYDEFHCALRGMGSENSNLRMLQKVFLEAYTTNDSVYKGRVKAGMADEPPTVWEPALTVHATATPEEFYPTITAGMIDGGLLARCTLVAGNARSRINTSPLNVVDLPETLIEQVKYWNEFRPEFHADGTPVGSLEGLGRPVLYMLPETPDGRRVLDEFAYYCDDEQERLAETAPRESALWTRLSEQAERIVSVYACSRNCRNPIIDADAAEWAVEWVKWCSGNLILAMRNHVADGVFDAKCLRFMDVVRKRGGIATRREVMKGTRFDIATADNVIETLQERGSIKSVERRGKRGPPTTAYRICKERD